MRSTGKYDIIVMLNYRDCFYEDKNHIYFGE